MPRTVYVRPPGWTGDPQSNTPEYVRGLAEERHRQLQRRYFEYPLLVHSAVVANAGNNDNDNDNDSKELLRSLSFLHFYDEQYSSRLLEEQTAEDCRPFCFKDCPIFITSPDSHPWWRRTLFDAVYREWFPHRAEDCDISYGSFFGHLMAFHNMDNTENKAMTLKEVLSFHEALCAKLSGLVGDIAPSAPLHRAQLGPRRDEQPRTAMERRTEQLNRPPTEYKLRPTFSKCFIVIEWNCSELCFDESEARRNGVLLVWRNGQDAVKHGCVVDEERGISAWDGEMDQLGQDARVFRCPLECAMRLVVATDNERSARRKEWNSDLEEWLGEDTEE